jgi:hypothetical protein
MKRISLVFTVAAVMTAIMVFAGPAFAQGSHKSCKAFGQNIAGLATGLGVVFGQTAAANAPLNGTVAAEQTALCEAN